MTRDGSKGLGDRGPIPGAGKPNAPPSELYDMATGSVIASSGLGSFVTRAGLPAFSVDTEHVAFNFYAGPGTAAPGPGDRPKLVSMDSDHTSNAFSNPRLLYQGANRPGWAAIFDLLRGALRVISGTIVARNRDNFQLRIPQATIGIRGTDFMVVLVNPVYTSVLDGAVSVSNAGGTTVLRAGSFGSVASANSLATPIPAWALPAAASAAFSSLGAAAGGAAASARPGS